MRSYELDSVILYVKNEFSNMLAKRKDLIIQLVDAYEKVVSNPQSICEEIKNTLLLYGNREKIISLRDIERYCPGKWKSFSNNPYCLNTPFELKAEKIIVIPNCSY
jgi:hypothetical protein